MLDIDKKTENGGATPQGRLSAQEFNQVVDAVNTLDSTRIGATFFDSGTTTQYQFASVADRDAWLADRTQSHLVIGTDTFALTGRMTQLSIIDYMGGSLLYFATHAQKAEITVGFKSEEKSVTDTAWNEVIEDTRFTVYVDKGKTGDFSIVAEDIDVFYGQNLTFDVFKYIATGANRVRFVANGKLSGAVATRTYEVNLTTMYLTAPADMGWHNPFMEGEPFALLFNIGGNINKVLHTRVTAEGYEHNYTVNIGTATYVNNTYPLRAIQFPSAENNQLQDSTRDNFTGVYTVEVWLDANGLTSDVITRHIICVAAADKTTAKLVCVNQVANPVYNGDTSTLFLYSLYNGGVGGQSDIEVTATVENNTIINKSLEVTTGQLLEFIDAVDYEIDSADTIRIAFNVTHGNTITWDVPLDNTYAYPPVTGYTFYMNEDTRSNGEANREFIINQVDGSQVETEWNRIAFVGDGHNVDDQGRKCLHIPAGSSATVKQTFMFNIPAAGKTIEMAFKIANAADFEENVISILGENGAGLQIKPRNVKLYSQKKQSSEYDLAQSYNIKDEEFVHMVVTIIPQYKSNYGRLAQIYINGVKKTSFEFDDGDSFQTSGFLQLGSLTADLYLYRMRIYDSGFEWPAVVQNFVNCLPSRTEKTHVWNRIRSILNDADVVDYDTCVRAGLNTMVIEMLDGASLPDKLHPTEEAVPNCNVTFNVYNRRSDELDDEMFQLLGGLKLENQPIEGQGTTAMTYYRWNLRWKLSKIIENKRRITAKKNVASSPHSHKMGATRMFNELHNAIVGFNELNGRVAVAQYPVYGFLAKPVDGAPGEYVYEYIGLYTVGPDKGDKHSFGYDNATYEGSIIHLEGTDHNVTGVGFDYPWITFTGDDGNEESTMVYDPAAEGLSVVGKQSNATPWEVGQAGELETDSTADADDVYNMLAQELKPAYDCVYNCSTAILGTTAALSEINANPAAWREILASDGRKYSNFEFWTDGVYDLYYYNVKYERYMPNGVNLLTKLGVDAATLAGMTTEQKNEHFKTLRRNLFKSTWTNYWDAEDAIFHDVFLELIGATDNFKKNNYPYKCKPLAQGGRWKRRQDDLDTIFDVNNQGYATKKYSILMGDTTDSGSVFRGEDSVFHTLVKECFPEEKKEMAHRIFDKMAELSKHGENSITRLIGYVRTCCWDYAQEYFTESAYNTDAEWTYEDAWALWGDEYQNDVNPLQQSLGSHYEAEKNWVELRMVFMASYYNWGPFAKDSGEDNSAGTVSFRAASGKSYTLTPAIDFNPTILIGQNDLRYAGGRNEAGTPVTVVVPDMGQNDTHIYIQGTDYLYDLGNLSDLQLSTDNSTLAVSAKRLRTLKVGDEDASKVSSNVTLLNMGSNPALEELDARNMVTLNNATIDLTGCPRIRRAYFKGTNIKGVRLVSGSKITELTLPDTITGLTLVGLPYLTTENLDYGSLANVVNLHVENSPHIDPFEMLRKAFDASTSLAGIRIVNFVKENGTVDDVNMLYTLATAMDESGMNKKYQGLDANGSLVTGSIPVVKGKLTLSESPYENEFNPANELFPGVIEPANGIYINFADPNVDAVVKVSSKGFGGDGTGVLIDMAKTITVMPTTITKNTLIETFDEFERFENIQLSEPTGNPGIYTSCNFCGCTSLKSIKLPPNITTIQSAFISCKSLESIEIPDSVTHISVATFSNCTSLKKVTIGKNVTGILRRRKGLAASSTNNELSYLPFYGCSSLKELHFCDSEDSSTAVVLDGARSKGAFYACPIETLYLGRNLMYTSDSANGTSPFYGITTLKTVTVGKFVTSLWTSLFSACTGLEAVHIFDLDAWMSIEFANDGSNPLVYAKNLYLNGELVTELTIPKDLNYISAFAFVNNTINTVYFNGELEEWLNFQFGEYRSNPIYNGGTLFINGVNANTITEVVLPDNITSLTAPLCNWTWLKKLSLGNSITSIGPGALLNCTGLTKLTIPSSVTSIGHKAFSDCTEISELVFEDSDNTLNWEYDSFSVTGASKLETVYIGRNLNNTTQNNYYDSPFSGKPIKNITFSNNVTGIGYYMFSRCSSLVSIVIPNSVKTLAGYCFSECTSLNSVTIPDSVTNMNGYAFNGCTNLDSVHVTDLAAWANISFYNSTSNPLYYANRLFLNGSLVEDLVIPEGVISISKYAFFSGHCFYSINLPCSIETIMDSAFSDCKNVTSVICKAVTPPAIQSNSFSPARPTGEEIIFYAPTPIAYREATNWTAYKKQIKHYYVEDSIVCTSLEIVSAEDVHGGKTTTNVHYRATINATTLWGEQVENAMLEDITVSDSFATNETGESVEKTITLTLGGMTASTTITQFKKPAYAVELNDQWQLSTGIANPDETTYDGVYESYSNTGSVANTWAAMYIDIYDLDTFDLYIRSNGATYYCYLMVSQLDKTITGTTSRGDATLVKANTYGKANTGTTIEKYEKVSFTGIGGGTHRITIIYLKTKTTVTGTDRGYVLIPKNQ